MKNLLSFPNPVNEVSARLVAFGVVTLTSAFLVTGAPFLLALLAYGFLARVLTGPTLSPLGQLVTRVVTPRLSMPPRFVPGPPKRFAQGIGALLSTAALVSLVGFGMVGASQVLVAMILGAASLEAFVGYCLGCSIFSFLMRAGVVPERICVECSNIWARPRTA